MDIAVRAAARKDIPALCEIWRNCFNDSDDYIRCFYRENFEHIAVQVCAMNGTPVSMLHLFDGTFVNGSEAQAAKLVYAVGTHPAYRQRGFMGRLLNAVQSRARQEGHVLFLKPATARLARFYQSFGFEPDACFRLVTMTPGEKKPLRAVPLLPEEYNRLRDAAFSARPYVKWPDRHVRWCVAENALFGGKTLAVTLNGSEHFLMGALQGKALMITETDLSLSQLKEARGSLCELFGAERLKAHLPDQTCEEGEPILSSVVYNAPLRNTYVNLIMI